MCSVYDGCYYEIKRILVDKRELSPIKQSDKQTLNYVIDNDKKLEILIFLISMFLMKKNNS